MIRVGEASAAARTIEVEPLAALPLGWCWATLADLAAPEKNAVTDGPFGSNLKTAHYTDAGPRVIRLQNVGDSVFKDAPAHISETHYASLLRHSTRPGDLVIAALGEDLPRACVIPGWLGPAVVKADCIRFRPNTRAVHARFLNYALNSSDTRRRTADVVHGVGRPRLTLGQIRGICVPVAPFGLQLRISDTLDELLSDLDAGVAALERARAKLKLYRASVLKAAVEGALTARWRAQHPNVEPASDLLDRILAERRRLWEEEQLAKFLAKRKEPPKNWKAKYKEAIAAEAANLPALPRGWCWVALDQLAEVGTGATPNRGNQALYYEGGSVPWVTSSCANDAFVREPSAHVTAKALEECNLTLYPRGTLLLAMYGEGRTRGMCTELQIESTTNQALASIQASAHVKSFLKVFLAKNYHDIRRAASGGVQPNLNLSLVREIVLPLPPASEQEAIVELVEDQMSVIDHLEGDIDAKLKSAQSLRQAILRHAFTGKLVPQDPNDEPASELLTRIAAEREARAGEAAAAKRPRKPRQRRARSN